MAVPWPTHRVKAARQRADRRRQRRAQSAADRAAHLELQRTTRAGR